MSDYIERQAVVDAVYPVDPENDGSDGGTVVLQNLQLSSADVEAIVCGIPAADVRPVVRAQWITQMEGLDQLRYTCTRCGFFRIAPTLVPHGWRFCPNCGAQMDPKEESNDGNTEL